jgi:hypothetical protein
MQKGVKIGAFVQWCFIVLVRVVGVVGADLCWLNVFPPFLIIRYRYRVAVDFAGSDVFFDSNVVWVGVITNKRC